MTQLLLGVDLGTTGVRCVAFDAQLGLHQLLYRECPPSALGGGLVEQEPAEWIEAARAVIAEVAAAVPDAGAIKALAISSQGITFVPVDAAGKPLRPALSWLDTRGTSMLPELDQSLNAAVVTARTGKPWDGGYPLAKLAWLARHEPEVVSATARFEMPLDHLMRWLTGISATDHTMAAGTMCYDLAARDWADDILEAARIRRDQLPQIIDAGEPVGTLLPEVAACLGLDPSVVVVMGGQDQKCASLAAGIGPRAITLSLGTAAALESLQTSPTVHNGVPTFSHLLPGQWVGEVAIGTAGAAIRWFSSAMAAGASPDQLSSRAASARAKLRPRPFFFPELGRVSVAAAAKRWEVEPSGVFWGLTLDASAEDLALALFEGLACEVQRLRAQLHAEADTLLVFGGGAASETWCELIADVTELRVQTLATNEAAAAGAALLAGAGIGLFPRDLVGAPRLPVLREYLPAADLAATRERYAQYLSLHASLYH